MHYRVKNLTWTFLLMPSSPRQNFPPGSDHYLPGREKLIIPGRQHFFENLFPSAEGEEKTMVMVPLILLAPILQNDQTHSNNSPAIYRRIV